MAGGGSVIRAAMTTVTGGTRGLSQMHRRRWRRWTRPTARCGTAAVSMAIACSATKSRFRSLPASGCGSQKTTVPTDFCFLTSLAPPTWQPVPSFFSYGFRLAPTGRRDAVSVPPWDNVATAATHLLGSTCRTSECLAYRPKATRSPSRYGSTTRAGHSRFGRTDSKTSWFCNTRRYASNGSWAFRYG